MDIDVLSRVSQPRILASPHDLQGVSVIAMDPSPMVNHETMRRHYL